MFQLFHYQVSRLALTAAALIAITVTCTHVDITNPSDPGFNGDYILSPAWTSLPDTLYAGETYAVYCTTSVAPDTFQLEQIYTSPAGFVDTTIKPDLTRKDSLSFLFTAAFTGEVYVKATRPNGKVLLDSFPVVVQASSYALSAVTFPAQINAREPAGFKVAIDSLAEFTAKNGRYYWHIAYGATATDTSGTALDSLTYTAADSMTLTISVYAKDSAGAESNTISQAIVVRRFSPTISFTKQQDTAEAGVALVVGMHARGTGPTVGASVDSVFIYVKGTPDSLIYKGTDTAASLVFAAGGAFVLKGYAQDNDGFLSAPDSMSVYVIVDKPYFVLPPRDTSVYAGDTLKMSVQAASTGSAQVTKFLWKGKGWSDSAATGQLVHLYATTQTDTVTAQCFDSNGKSSVSDTFTVAVLSGSPVINGVTPDTAWLNDSTVFTISSKGKHLVTSYSIQWDASGVFQTASDSIISHRYTTAGMHRVRCVVADINGNTSDTASDSVFVKTSTPGFVSITSDTLSSHMYILDPITWRVKGSDTHGEIDSVVVSWNGGTTFATSVAAVGDSASCTHTFARSDSGSHTVVFRVKDNLGSTHDSSIVIAVMSGAPTIPSISVDTAGNNIFVLDKRKYDIHVFDANGFVRRIYVSWDQSGSATDTLVVNGNRSAIDTFFTHAYDTTGGTKTIRFQAMDDDSVLSAEKDTTITVRKAAPVLWGDSGDTIWVVVDSGSGGNYAVHVNSCDTNGTIVKYYWSEENSFDSSSIKCVKTNDSTRTRLFGANDMNKSVDMWIYGLDDDGFLRGGQFVVFADSAPQAISSTSDPVTGGRKISWSGLDKKDSLATQFRILVKKGGQPDTSENSPDVAKDWTAGSDTAFNYTPTNAKPFSWVYTPVLAPYSCDGIQCTYYYQIISRDARGSKSYCPTGLNFDY